MLNTDRYENILCPHKMVHLKFKVVITETSTLFLNKKKKIRIIQNYEISTVMAINIHCIQF